MQYRLGASSRWSGHFSKRTADVAQQTVEANDTCAFAQRIVIAYFFFGFFFSLFGFSPLPMTKSMP
jgi:hypothetical protein